MRVIFGITIYLNIFNRSTTLSLDSPDVNAEEDEIYRFMKIGGMNILHEIMHLISLNGKKSYPVLCESNGQTNLSYRYLRSVCSLPTRRRTLKQPGLRELNLEINRTRVWVHASRVSWPRHIYVNYEECE